MARVQERHRTFSVTKFAHSTPAVGAGVTGAKERMDGGTFHMTLCATSHSDDPCASRLKTGRGQPAASALQPDRRHISMNEPRVVRMS